MNQTFLLPAKRLLQITSLTGQICNSSQINSLNSKQVTRDNEQMTSHPQYDEPMASNGPLIPDYAERITETLASLGIDPAQARPTFRKIDRLQRQQLELHPTYNFKVRTEASTFYFRALIRNDASLRRMRHKTMSTLLSIETQLPKRPSFVVPHVIESGTHGHLVWDLEELIEGRHLPCGWNRPSQLAPWLNQVPKQMRAFRDIEQLDLDVPIENWNKQHRSALGFINWARTCPDLEHLPLDQLTQIQTEFHRNTRTTELATVHGDPWQGNIITRTNTVPAILDWDEVHRGAPGEMYGRHWILMCSEPRWQESVIKHLGKRDESFWIAFHAYAWIRAIDQIHYELTTFEGRHVRDYAELLTISPKRAGFVDQMLKALYVLSLNPGGPPQLLEFGAGNLTYS